MTTSMVEANAADIGRRLTKIRGRCEKRKARALMSRFVDKSGLLPSKAQFGVFLGIVQARHWLNRFQEIPGHFQIQE